MAEEKRHNIGDLLWSHAEDLWFVFVQELRRIFHDKGVVTIFVVAVLAYPILYPFIYYHEAVTDLPIAVIDACHSQHSREYIRKLDATREVKTAYECVNMMRRSSSTTGGKCTA
ncbi:MAG: hypothetical protein II970_09180 [Paludibacteraceae bacterium]|nr:hypothetical protein [Paludibacteraceae bacterium]